MDLATLARGLTAAERQLAMDSLRQIEHREANRGKALMVEARPWLPDRG